MKSEIKFTISLDENKVPEKLFWDAEDGGISNQETTSIFISVWDYAKKEALKIDLWTKEMTVDDMKKFYHQVFHSMANTYERATNEDDVAHFISEFAEEFAKRARIK